MSRRSRGSKPPSVGLVRVERLADLSRLSIGPQEAERLQGELSSILEYFAVIDKVEVPKALASREAPQSSGLRGDVVRPSTPDAILKGVPQRKGRYVRAPRVF